jgi:hypothetical protein
MRQQVRVARQVVVGWRGPAHPPDVARACRQDRHALQSLEPSPVFPARCGPSRCLPGMSRSHLRLRSTVVVFTRRTVARRRPSGHPENSASFQRSSTQQPGASPLSRAESLSSTAARWAATSLSHPETTPMPACRTGTRGGPLRFAREPVVAVGAGRRQSQCGNRAQRRPVMVSVKAPVWRFSVPTSLRFPLTPRNAPVPSTLVD